MIHSLTPSFFNAILAITFFCACLTVDSFAQENTAILCSDGIDNDGNGLTDCDDPQCIEVPLKGCSTCFNDGLSFADYVIEYSQPCGPSNIHQNPDEALGIANDTVAFQPRRYTSLGEGGFIKLGFSDNLVINSGDNAPDIWVFESGSAVESSSIELRPADPITITALTTAGVVDSDNDGFYEFGVIMGATSSIDIDELVPGQVTGILKFNAIKITDVINGDCGDESPGADIDAVCALSSVSSEVCDNGIDDDLDGFIDCDDPQLMNDCCCLVTNTLDLGPDITTCEGDTIILSVPNVFNSYEWSTGSMQTDITVTATGNYSITVGEVSDCQLIDDISITIAPDPNLDITVFKCPEDDVVVEGRTFTQPGIYFDTVISQTGVCDSFFQFTINNYQPAADFLGPDQLVCGRELQLNSPFSLTTWPDGSTGRVFAIDGTGDFVATAIDTNDCFAEDTVSIQLVNLGRFYMPNAFSPNNDGVNDIFQPFFAVENNLAFRLTIYDRWGATMFDQTGINVFWDGMTAGDQIRPGTYVYKLSYKSEQCEVEETYTGSILLVH